MNWGKWETKWRKEKKKFMTHRLEMTRNPYEKETWSFTLDKNDPNNVLCCHFYNGKCINTIELTVENARERWNNLVKMGAISDVK